MAEKVQLIWLRGSIREQMCYSEYVHTRYSAYYTSIEFLIDFCIEFCKILWTTNNHECVSTVMFATT